ncbi:MAG: hypothetical protein EU532_05515 [Promethearchaeota archaeon]|nr:MAG: hypothetical protein EU532_05515 [Candidatus Lokiarchaeota archaeon]
MSCLIVAGGGKFGKKALEFGIKNNYKIILIDNDPNCICASDADYKFDNLNDFYSRINDVKAGKIVFLISDVSIITDLFLKLNPEYIIPVIPIHLLAYIISDFLKQKKALNLISDSKSAFNFIEKANSKLILSYNLDQGVVYLSYCKIDEICPDNCVGPEKYCPNFKREKPVTITKYLQNYYQLTNHFRFIEDKSLTVIIIGESYQLMGGLGGLKGSEIYNSLKKLENILDTFSNRKYTLIIATTCNCHGVINFYKQSP